MMKMKNKTISYHAENIQFCHKCGLPLNPYNNTGRCLSHSVPRDQRIGPGAEHTYVGPVSRFFDDVTRQYQGS